MLFNFINGEKKARELNGGPSETVSGDGAASSPLMKLQPVKTFQKSFHKLASLMGKQSAVSASKKRFGELPLKATSRDKEEIQEVTVRIAASKINPSKDTSAVAIQHERGNKGRRLSQWAEFDFLSPLVFGAGLVVCELGLT